MKYIVNEIQKLSNGDINNITSTYEDSQDAEIAYKSALEKAEVSDFPAHIVVLMSGSGVHIKHKSYVHAK